MERFKKKRLFYVIGIVLVILAGAIIILCSQASSSNNEGNDNALLYQTNSNEQTYGHAEADSYEQISNLTRAIGKNYIEGYVRNEDLLSENIEKCDVYFVEVTDDQLEIARSQYKEFADVPTMKFYKKCVDIPLFDESGKKEVDQFTITRGYFPYPEND